MVAYLPEGVTPEIQRAFDNAWPNIGSALDDRADRLPHQVGWMYPDDSGNWQEASWAEFRDWVHEIAAGLISLDFSFGEVASICAGTSIRWIMADLALGTIGGVTCTVYPNTRQSDIALILEDSASSWLFVQDQKLLEKILDSGPAAAALKHIIVLQGGVTIDDPRVHTWDQLRDLGTHYLNDFPRCVGEAQDKTNQDTLATIIYTSGTTGRPKGVELTHGTWIYQGIGWGANDAIYDRMIHFLWLPLAHGFGKCMLLINLYVGAITAVDGRIDQIVPNLAKLKPDFMCGVPRIFEKVRTSALAAAPADTPKGKIITWAMNVGEKAFPYRSAGLKMPKGLAAQYALANKLVFSTIREKLGGRLQFVISGSAKLNPDLQRWFFNIGVPLLEGYGVTETAAVSYFNRPKEPRFGSVGRVIPGSTTRIDPDTGEVLIKGPGVMRGYHNDPELTAQQIHDGWFHTGDIGHLDKDRFLYITDRMKDVIKTSNGKFVSPSEVESALTGTSQAISQAVVVGEGHKFCAALVSLDPEWVAQWCKANDLGDIDYSTAISLPQIHSVVERDVEAANKTLDHWETVKRFEILPAEMTVDDGTATPTLKIRRSHAIEHFDHLIKKIYADEETAHK
ncbi:MAG: AMP-dependent synthetase/ligase [Ancrocorticia sp.]|uniref:AMP-dependent synthetase/ligase n=1 Tax=Ancrocorticia sp. TaxID=2593684 RepID=UPI003F8F58C3